MKNHGLQVAKLSRFKSGPNISVSYVSFLHAARDLFTAWPAYSVHHCAQSFRADFSDSACKQQKLRKRTPTHAFQALYRSLASEIAKKALNVCGQYITA